MIIKAVSFLLHMWICCFPFSVLSVGFLLLILDSSHHFAQKSHQEMSRALDERYVNNYNIYVLIYVKVQHDPDTKDFEGKDE